MDTLHDEPTRKPDDRHDEPPPAAAPHKNPGKRDPGKHGQATAVAAPAPAAAPDPAAAPAPAAAPPPERALDVTALQSEVEAKIREAMRYDAGRNIGTALATIDWNAVLAALPTILRYIQEAWDMAHPK